MADILVFGLREVRYRELRRGVALDDLVFDIDTWPGLPTFVEIEGPDEATVRRGASLLGFDYAEARFGSVDAIYGATAATSSPNATLLFTEADRAGLLL